MQSVVLKWSVWGQRDQEHHFCSFKFWSDKHTVDQQHKWNLETLVRHHLLSTFQCNVTPGSQPSCCGRAVALYLKRLGVTGDHHRQRAVPMP